MSDLVADLNGFLTAADLEPPYLLVGQSMGANIVFMYAQAYPDAVAGFVSMNPVPPFTDWIRAARKVETKAELQNYEIALYGARTMSRSHSRARTRCSRIHCRPRCRTR